MTTKNSDPISAFNRKHGGTRPAQPTAPKAETRRMIQGTPVDEIVGVALPERPVFDKVMALFLFLTFGLGKKRADIDETFWGGSRVFRNPQGIISGGNRPTKAQEERWTAKGVYPIDVGRNKYQARGTASACECVALDLGLIQKWNLGKLFQASHEWVPPMNAGLSKGQLDRAKRRARKGKVWLDGREVDAAAVLAERVSDPAERVALEYVLLAGRNNGTGFLKEAHYSIVYLMRELQKHDAWTPEERAVNQPHEWTIDEVVDLTLEFIEADYQVRVGLLTGAVTVPVTKTLLEHEALGEYFEKKILDEDGNVVADVAPVGTNFAPFTLARHMRNQVALGVSDAEISARADFVLEDVVGHTQVQREKAEALAAQAVVTRFGGGFGAIISSADPAIADNPRIARALFRSQVVRMVVVVNSRRNISVLTDGTVPLGAIAQRFLSQEPALWFYDPRIGALLNGGHSFGKVPATAVPLAEIVGELERVALEFKR